ncbi:hypothetical protein RN001_014956 [Aquatica leii]|uniref:RZ-type domain-containing protein n=1 Tax=Aquatica leii TaxID=1421715 RepID=A0AAN7SBT5_9COLE|nr:hypothetical protein RN001_014956 [Aquatica leii]
MDPPPWRNRASSSRNQTPRWRDRSNQETNSGSFNDIRNFPQSRRLNSNPRAFTSSNEALHSSFGRHNAAASNSNIHERQRHQKEMVYTFKRLETLSEKEPTSIIVEIMGRQTEFEKLLGSELSKDAMVLVVKLLAQVCSTELVNTKAVVLTLASIEDFHKSLQRFVLDLLVQDFRDRKRSSYFWNDPDDFIGNAAVIFQTLIEGVPSRAYEVLPKTLKSFKVMLTSPCANSINKELLTQFERLETTLESCKLKRTRKIGRSEDDSEEEDDSLEQPPDDFRHLNIYPSTEELQSDRVFLRKNLIDKSYTCVDHYLDVQFRLMKEDFVAPLRAGIAEYLQYTGAPKPVIKASDVRVYTNVQFLSPKTTLGQLGVLVQFQSKQGKYKVNFNKRFMYGSLLCFTNDHFQSLLFGKVIERSIELLQNGQVVVGFEPEQSNNYLLEQAYVMIECSVYFEPYYHVLKALQNMDEAHFPMKKYIIDLDSNIDTISYLNPLSRLTINGNMVHVHNNYTWPNADALQLDITQYEAFQTALTKELVVIQGPPGTGKTFLGLKIAKTLIENRNHWYKSSPILIVCYTNHALDQFLEGLKDTTVEMVRIGGQSKNKNVEQFTLKEKRKLFKRSSIDNRALRAVAEKVSECLSRLNYFSDILKDIDSNSVLLDFKNFRVIDESICSTWFVKASDQELVDWLLGGRSNEQRRMEKNKAKLKQLEEDQENNLSKEFDEIIYNQTRSEHEIDMDIDIEIQKKPNHTLTSIERIKSSIEQIRIQETNEADFGNINKLALQQKRFQLEDQLDYLQAKFEEYEEVKVRNRPQQCNLQNPHFMLADDRWQLYLYWVDQYRQHLTKNILNLQTEYTAIQEQYNELKSVFDLEIMKQMLVVGMTTTGAARLQTIIKNLKSPIVIVEEAAEVLESHVVVSLTSHCKHLILIGDHQQLRPSTSNYYIEKHFNLGISLFERMVRNNLHCHVLGVQHRMRPEFANLIVPAIYPKLENHISVQNFPKIAGIVKSLYFIDHEFEEEESADSSKLNQHEAKFLIALARYLIQNGYKPEEITIIAAYSAQMFILWKEQKKCLNLLEGVRITVLDNYQGEENKIILLSLVRNNKIGKIGFLKIENRVCVALSRAKEGFYIMGNMDFLGQSLLLQCQIHPEQTTQVTLPEDFSKVPEGGCNRNCSAQLTCGHMCTMVCHVLDRKHESFKCKAKCIKILCENDHSCPDRCYEPCSPCVVPMTRILQCTHKHKLPCYVNLDTFKCPTPVRVTLPCGHEDAKKPCHCSIDEYKCPFPCDTRVDTCGHACVNMCHFRDDPDHLTYKCGKPCEKPRHSCSTGEHKCPLKCFEECPPCQVVVEKKRLCTHKVTAPCNQDPNEIQCIRNCKRMLPCGHACKKKCCEPCGDCNVMVIKEIAACKHQIKIKCSRTPTRADCSEKCRLFLSCGHKCKNKCNEPCTAACKELVDYTGNTACGHSIRIECHMRQKVYPSNSSDLLKFCTSPCGTTLSCSHVCSGTCGECAQGRIHKACTEKCGAVLVCGHPCPINCRDACQPCEIKCNYKCKHSKCTKMCGEPCTKCTEQCTRKCVHVKCTAVCGDICTVPPCNEPCLKKLPCDHFCVGFCGDPCPPLCRECNYDELTDIFFGDEDEENARFVVLNECGHVFESTGIDTWLEGDEEDQGKIAPKCCPRCKTILTSTQRYSDHIKKSLLSLSKVKEKYFGTQSDNDRRRVELLDKILALKKEEPLMTGSTFNTVIETFERAIHSTRDGRRQPLNMILYTVYLAKLQILENIIQICNNKNTNINGFIGNINFLLTSLLRNKKQLSTQEATDLQREVKRFSFVVRLNQIRESQYFRHFHTLPRFMNKLKDIENIVFSIKIFTDFMEADVEKHLEYFSKAFNVVTSKIQFNEVIKAMGMAKGHWFQCPNGHIYAIGECGGAMQTGKCADCGAGIGGSSHTLLPNNRHAGDVDGSRFAAYSEEANNLFNYEEFRNA